MKKLFLLMLTVSVISLPHFANANPPTRADSFKKLLKTDPQSRWLVAAIVSGGTLGALHYVLPKLLTETQTGKDAAISSFFVASFGIYCAHKVQQLCRRLDEFHQQNVMEYQRLDEFHQQNVMEYQQERQE